jgi:hypothetical protein
LGSIASALVRNGKSNSFKKPRPMDGQASPIPHGFNNAEEFQEFSSRLKRELPEGTQPLFQGSSVTGRSYKSGEAFDEGRRSDFDIALVGPDLFEQESGHFRQKTWRILGFRIYNVN